MIDRSYFTQEELHDYDILYQHRETLDWYYNHLVHCGLKVDRRKKDDNDDDCELNPNRFLCDRVWNKRSNR